ncbi:pilus assembly PilX family protein [Steroidobacter cummioxidans]|uniref:pilus assembly PilX family protein n=1 Tax=Steroidobacter cummioxidans TaxID=1803913 RepID=UPI0019D457F4|nr:PilX N-terminal domain-containing pilus assembly protein [Steroidobacter cummioxidans]
MTGSLRNIPSQMRSGPATQRGVALVVALVLLLVATVIGLASVRGTNLQERMSANMYDRSLAFQRAESALRAAEDAITGNWQISALGGVDCTAAGVVCNVMPDDTFTASATPNPSWVAVPDVNNINNDKTPGRPQYFIQYMGTGSGDSDFGLDANAGSGSYSEAGNSAPVTVAFYRITARSSNPIDLDDRSLVVLQTTVKRAI